MSSFEVNKVVGAILMTFLLILGLGFLSELLYQTHDEPEEPVYLVAAEDAEPAAEAEAEAETAEAAPPAVPGIAERLAEADAEHGAVIARKCTACHSLERDGPHKMGPNLWGIVGAWTASKEDFSYSSALQELGGAWDYARLDAFLAAPKAYAPGTKMAFPGIPDAGERADLIAHLRTLSDSPPALPAPPEAAETVPTAEAEAEGEEAVAEAEAEAPEQEGDALAARLAAADPAAGEKAAGACTACHTFDKGGRHRLGPNLWGVVGADVAHHDDFRYSGSMTGLDGTWTYEKLDAFLESPRDYVKGTKMAFPGLADADARADVIAYLRTLSDEPPPLPEP